MHSDNKESLINTIKEELKMLSGETIVFGNDDGPCENLHETVKAIDGLFDKFKIEPKPRFVIIVPSQDKSASGNLIDINNDDNTSSNFACRQIISLCRQIDGGNLLYNYNLSKTNNKALDCTTMLNKYNSAHYYVYDGRPATVTKVVNNNFYLNSQTSTNIFDTSEEIALIISGTNDGCNLGYRTVLSSTVGLINQCILGAKNNPGSKFKNAHSMAFSFGIRHNNIITVCYEKLNENEKLLFTKCIQQAFITNLLKIRDIREFNLACKEEKDKVDSHQLIFNNNFGLNPLVQLQGQYRYNDEKKMFANRML